MKRFWKECFLGLLLGIVLPILSPFSLARDDHDAPPKKTEEKGGKPSDAPAPHGRTTADPELPPAEDTASGACAVGRVIDFANGERYNFNFLKPCLLETDWFRNGPPIPRVMLSQVNFQSSGPYRLDALVNQVMSQDPSSRDRVDKLLQTRIPPLLRSSPLTSRDLSLLGQLVFLSPETALIVDANLIDLELMNYGSGGPADESKSAAERLANRVLMMGLDENAIASKVAASVEEMALLVQADSLSKIFRGLAAVSTANGALAPAFNLSASALNRGVQRGKAVFQKKEKEELLRAVFLAVQTSAGASTLLDPGQAELNEALGVFLDGKSLNATSLKRLWKASVRVLTQGVTQTALAEAIGMSLTPEVVRLPQEDLEALFRAARNYPTIAAQIQENFLLGWQTVWNDLHSGNLTPKGFNKMKTDIFEPMVANILDLDPTLISPPWLKAVVGYSLVPDELIQKKFPRMVLALMDRRNPSSRRLASESQVDTLVTSAAQSFAMVWTLTHVHLPALLEWIERFDKGQR